MSIVSSSYRRPVKIGETKVLYSAEIHAYKAATDEVKRLSSYIIVTTSNRTLQSILLEHIVKRTTLTIIIQCLNISIITAQW